MKTYRQARSLTLLVLGCLCFSGSIFHVPVCGADVVRVGIFDFDKVDGIVTEERTVGDEGMYKALEGEKGIEVSFVRSFEKRVLKDYDVLILPQTTPIKLLPADFKQILSTWVEEGHGLLVTHDAVGYRKFGSSIFPEICSGGVYNTPSSEGIITRMHPVAKGMEPKTEFEHTYSDHIVLGEGPKGVTVIREVRDNEETDYKEVGGPIMIVGQAGKGRYAACGICIGWDKVAIPDHRYTQGQEQESPPKGIERQILINTIGWLAGATDMTQAGEELVKEGARLAKLAKEVEEEPIAKPSPEEEQQIAAIKSARADIFPLPKQVKWGNDKIVLADRKAAKAIIVIDESASDKAELGANEISSKCNELAGTSLPIRKRTALNSEELKGKNLIIIGKADSKLIQEYLQKHKAEFADDYRLTADTPGKQGYIVRCFTNEYGNRCVLLGGSDDQGTLYACYTFLYLMEQKADKVYALEANIKDWPDYGYRCCACLYTLKGQDMGRMKQYIDFLAKRKVNRVDLGTVSLVGSGSAEKLNLGQLSEYGRRRGVYVSVLSFLNLGWSTGGLVPIRPSCGASKAKGLCYGDDMLKKQAETLTEFCSKYKPGVLRFHYIDSDPFAGCGGDAGWWLARCDVCKGKYKDHERWKADRDLINSMYKAIKKGSPDTMMEFIQWPYHPSMITGEWPLHFGSEKKYKRYLKRLTAEIPEDVFLIIREASLPQVKAWDECSNRHQRLIWWQSFDGFCRWVSNWGRNAATSWTGNRDDAFEINSCALWLCYEMSMLIGDQYGWNVKTPGYKVWDDLPSLRAYNMTMKPTCEPEFIFKTLVPLISRDIYGAKAGPYVERALKTNIERGLPGIMGGWQHSRWEVDIEGKKRAENGKIVDPLKLYGEIREEANTMYANMAEAMKNLPKDELRRWTVETLWYKARELRCRGEGFYHWVLAARAMEGDDKGKAQEELNIAIAYLDREWELMKEAHENKYPLEVTDVFGYVPTGYAGKPYVNIRAWAVKKALSVPAESELKELLEKIDRKPKL
ncbi:MAG: ThuA domain-containing protein [Verrucomicrobia bacterium]|nr:ThuA domain-containing protein [Verrucomicrobiota bacterium]MBU1735192.1 ThuA domain-containing protein [Verrucomicrobiota bacterium]MBU1855975.1 ThuA domain-containing protein [Verrucomicrobiota bacterium]